MNIKCEVCQEPFEAKRKTARFCSSGCRVRAHRGSGESGQVLALKAEKKDVEPAPTEGIIMSHSTDTVESATRAVLEGAGRVDSVMGQTALVLARRLDGGSFDTGSAVAALARQLETTMEAAVAGAHVADDPVDELRRRRDEKLGNVS